MKQNKTNKKTILALLASIGLANIGEWIYFIALNIMILNNGGTAMSVGMLYIIRPISDIVTNSLFSAYVDRLSKKKWMVLLSLFRAILVGTLIYNQSLAFIYVIVFGIQICSTVYEPLSLGYIVLAIPDHKKKKFNSLNSLVSSGGFLIGPAVAGLILSVSNPLVAIIINSIALSLSSIILLCLPNFNLMEHGESVSFLEENKLAIHFLKEFFQSNRDIVFFYLCISSLFIFAAGLDSVEAAFSKGVLYMSDGQYGLLVSIAGAGFLVGSLLNHYHIEKFSIKGLIRFGGVLYVVGYLIFSLSFNFLSASVGFFFISFALAFINTGFKTFIQLTFPVNKIGQLTTAFNIFNSLIEMLVVATVSGLGSFVPLRIVLISTEILMSVVLVFIFIYSHKLKSRI